MVYSCCFWLQIQHQNATAFALGYLGVFKTIKKGRLSLPGSISQNARLSATSGSSIDPATLLILLPYLYRTEFIWTWCLNPDYRAEVGCPNGEEIDCYRLALNGVLVINWQNINTVSDLWTKCRKSKIMGVYFYFILHSSHLYTKICQWNSKEIQISVDNSLCVHCKDLLIDIIEGIQSVTRHDKAHPCNISMCCFHSF